MGSPAKAPREQLEKREQHILRQRIGVLLGIVLGMSLSVGNRNKGSVSLRFNNPLKTSTSKYARFEALNFQLYAGGAPTLINTTVNPECDDLKSLGTMEGVQRCYMGHKNVSLDIQARLDVMTEAVQRAYKEASQDPTTLKIFIAPEFFFRGRNGGLWY